MPARNVIKEYGQDSFYHIYNRGAYRERIFLEKQDYRLFLYILKRHLSKEPMLDKQQRPYLHLRDNVELIAYCLMPNHFHLLVFNKEQFGITKLMRSITTAYSMYYNKKYDHSGHVFQGVYKASLIDEEAYLQHITRYIHRNPVGYTAYPYSSYRPLIDGHNVEWLSDKLFEDIFEGSRKEYKAFVADYEDYKESLGEITIDLADH